VTQNQSPRARKPQGAPTAADLAERDAYAKVTADSAQAVRGSAKTWQAALAGFLTLATAGVFLKGRDSTADLPAGWKLFVVTSVGVGLLFAISALWHTVAAEAGTHPQRKTLQEIRNTYGTLNAYQVHLAVVSARRLRWAIYSAAVAMALLIVGIAATWLAPGIPSPQSYLEVIQGNEVACGIPLSAPQGEIRLAAHGQTTPFISKIEDITALTLTTMCP